MNLPPELLVEQLSYLSPKQLCRLNLSKELQHIQKKFILKALLTRLNSTKREDSDDLERIIYKLFRLKVLHLPSQKKLIEYYNFLQIEFSVNQVKTTVFNQFQFTKNSLDKLLDEQDYDILIYTVMRTISDSNRKRGFMEFPRNEILKFERRFPSRKSLIDYFRLHILERRGVIGREMLKWLTTDSDDLYNLSVTVLAKFVDAYYNDLSKYIDFDDGPFLLNISKKDYKYLLENLTKKELCLIIKDLGV